MESHLDSTHVVSCKMRYDLICVRLEHDMHSIFHFPFFIQNCHNCFWLKQVLKTQLRLNSMSFALSVYSSVHFYALKTYCSLLCPFQNTTRLLPIIDEKCNWKKLKVSHLFVTPRATYTLCCDKLHLQCITVNSICSYHVVYIEKIHLKTIPLFLIGQH